MKRIASIVWLLSSSLAAAGPEARQTKPALQCQSFEGASATVSIEADGVHAKLSARLVNHRESELLISGTSRDAERARTIEGAAQLALVFPAKKCTTRGGNLVSCDDDAVTATLTGNDKNGHRVTLAVAKPLLSVQRTEVFRADSPDPRVTYQVSISWPGAAGFDSWAHNYQSNACTTQSP